MCQKCFLFNVFQCLLGFTPDSDVNLESVDTYPVIQDLAYLAESFQAWVNMISLITAYNYIYLCQVANIKVFMLYLLTFLNKHVLSHWFLFLPEKIRSYDESTKKTETKEPTICHRKLQVLLIQLNMSTNMNIYIPGIRHYLSHRRGWLNGKRHLTNILTNIFCNDTFSIWKMLS